MAKRVSAGKVEFWTAAIELFRESTLSVREFCNREGLSYSTFCRWQERLTNKNETDDATLGLNSKNMPTELADGKAAQRDPSDKQGKSVSSPDDVQFISAGVMVAGVEAKAGIEIQFSSGVSINLCTNFDRVAFKDVVSILGAELC